MTVEIDSILVNEELAALLEAAEANGQIRQVELNEILEPLGREARELEPVNPGLALATVETAEQEESAGAFSPSPE